MKKTKGKNQKAKMKTSPDESYYRSMRMAFIFDFCLLPFDLSVIFSSLLPVAFCLLIFLRSSLPLPFLSTLLPHPSPEQD